MDTPPSALLTPLGARTPLNHPALYSVIAVLSLVIIAGAVWVFWPTPASEPTPTVTPSANLSTPADISAWKTFDSALINLSFHHPASLSYREEDALADRNIVHTGREVHFFDSSRSTPSFVAMTDDFSAVDSIPHDIIDGTLEDEYSFRVTVFDERPLSIISSPAPGMYRVIGAGNMECSPFVSALLFVRPPEGSGLQYLQFFLGSIPEFTDSDYEQDPSGSRCELSDAAIERAILALADDAEIALRTEVAIAIARTFTVRSARSR
jgi:hypothetical protein